jgi:hypothetical protein
MCKENYYTTICTGLDLNMILAKRESNRDYPYLHCILQPRTGLTTQNKYKKEN